MKLFSAISYEVSKYKIQDLTLIALTTDLGDLDLLGEVAGLGDYAKVLPFSEELELYGMRCRVLSLEGLIKNKRAVGRAKDLRLLPELEALLEIRKSQKKS